MIDIFRKKDAIAIKEEYQEALNYTHRKIDNKVKWIYMMNHKLKDNFALIIKYKKDIVADEEEREGAYNALGNLLKNEKGHEGNLWEETTKMYKEIFKNRIGKGTKISQKTKRGNQEVRFNSMIKVIDKYLEYQTKDAFRKIMEKIISIEKGIKETKKKYHKAISEVSGELLYWDRNIMEAEDLIKRFNNQLKEGTEKLKKMRYLKSIIYRLASEREKMKVNIHTLYYRVEERGNTIKQLKNEFEEMKKKDLENIS